MDAAYTDRPHVCLLERNRSLNQIFDQLHHFAFVVLKVSYVSCVSVAFSKATFFFFIRTQISLSYRGILFNMGAF